MRIAATAATLLFALAACSTTSNHEPIPFQQPNSLMAGEIDQRIEQIPFQHREELLQNLLWLAQTGEQTIPALLNGLQHDNAKVRSSCCWVLGRLRDRRTIPNLQALTKDSETSVRMEASRTLVTMGDLQHAPKLIEGLDSDRKEVRYMCHEALKTATGHDFGYDHLESDQHELHVAVLQWRQWWGEYSGDAYFAQSYEAQYGLNNVAAPAGETQMQEQPEQGQPEQGQPEQSQPQQSQPEQGQPQQSQPEQGQPQVEQPNPNGSAEPVETPAVETPPATEPVESNGESQSEEPAVIELPATETGNGNGYESGSEEPAVVEVPAVETPAGNGAGGQNDGR